MALALLAATQRASVLLQESSFISRLTRRAPDNSVSKYHYSMSLDPLSVRTSATVWSDKSGPVRVHR